MKGRVDGETRAQEAAGCRDAVLAADPIRDRDRRGLQGRGIGRKTGYRWRAENGGLPPARVAGSSRSSRYLSLLERQRIATLHRDGLGVRAIAARLGRSPSTVSRELRRNMRPHDNGHYDGDLAHARARERARRPRRGRLLAEPGLRAEVQAKLELEWSPEQIAAWLRAPTRPGRRGTSATRPSTRRSTTPGKAA